MWKMQEKIISHRHRHACQGGMMYFISHIKQALSCQFSEEQFLHVHTQTVRWVQRWALESCFILLAFCTCLVILQSDATTLPPCIVINSDTAAGTQGFCTDNLPSPPCLTCRLVSTDRLHLFDMASSGSIYVPINASVFSMSWHWIVLFMQKRIKGQWDQEWMSDKQQYDASEC